MQRQQVTAIRERPRAQVLVIGGGINGISTFRDLALQGVDVLLVERGDFASGASSASSHMIHGGIRYLENGEFRLVKESVQERNGLLKTAPHYVKPLRTTIPIFSTFSGILTAPLRFLTHRSGPPVERGAALIKAGLVLYDAFSGAGRVAPRHAFHGRRRSLAQLPALNPDLKYTATYFDASMHDPERLALDVLLDGEAEGGRAVNYVEAVGRSAQGVRLRDHLTGEEFTVAADVVVNASGPWTDLTNEALGTRTRFLGGTKGSHIVLDHPELLAATAGREIFFENSDGRIVLIYPLKDRVMVGTTDIDADPREPVQCTEAEVDYFFDLIRIVFPRIAVDRSQIVYRFSGIRPLPRHDDMAPGFVSRDYRIVVDHPSGSVPTVSLVGGKWTTFRALGEHLATTVLGLLGAERIESTVGRVIGGGRDWPRTESDQAAWRRLHLGEDSPRTRKLLERYGTRAREVAAFLAEGSDEPLLGDDLTVRELEWMVQREHVARLADVVLRRTDLGFTGRADDAALVILAGALGALLGWDADTRDAELDAVRARVVQPPSIVEHA
ncbi:glycerol-3-phosphate dehydrogenase/oxidase [Microbacterium stercoris]|uniref:Glycerol-3-phosphate dehydrogenase/oxidase n=1 Tax=Microbacterium stercoris TaxID=2820289 RepID=A0A939TUE8_9MICO|nr:glycerol-3-phosphate dehydrogenase/oxidase [Microbacterium stercoris]MBO3663959.1 glycerol-3-phosphate dehydrogenase/oxidase [Microbacterium stercoris]